MWTVIGINNETHKVKVRHSDGEIMDMEFPESARRTAADKTAWLKSQTDARDVKKAKDAKKWKRPYLLYALCLAEAVVIVYLLMGH